MINVQNRDIKMPILGNKYTLGIEGEKSVICIIRVNNKGTTALELWLLGSQV
jgi:hypothetical protein